ncbi:MAG: L,D-transpeptidase [Verrucomicrobia bacterium]|nr:L,D-transpeptidase [Leptolyngbya sp. ES-bin-22]
MAVTVRDDRLSRSVMFLFVGAALVLLGIQWRAWAANRQDTTTTSNTTANVKGTQSSAITANRKDGFKGNSDSATTATTLKRSAKLVIDLSDRRVYVYREQALVTSYPIAIGQAGWETPSGSFQVLEMQRDPKWQHPITGEVIPVGAANPLGKRWIGFLYEGRTHIGFHGTNQEELIGQAVSHGCVRMQNRDVVALYDQISLGTSVDVRP